MMGGETDDAEPGETITETAFENKVSYEGSRTSSRDFPQRSAPTGFKHLAGSQGGEAFSDHSVVLGGIANCVMQEIAVQHADASTRIHLQRLVDVSSFPTAF